MTDSLDSAENLIMEYLDGIGLRITCPSEKRHESFSKRVNLLQVNDLALTFRRHKNKKLSEPLSSNSES